MKATIFMAAMAALTAGFLHGDPVTLQVRQFVIRAPEPAVIELITNEPVPDTQLAARLWGMVREGQAGVVSDVTSAADPGESISVSSGQHLWLPAEPGQEVDRLFMIPTAFNERFVGTSLECLLRPGKQVQADWKTSFSPRGPLTVQWPTSWLDTWDWKADRHSGQAVHGWLDWRDLFEESVIGEVSFSDARPSLVAILPPGDQLWPTDRTSRWLDVFMAEVVALEKPVSAQPAATRPPENRTMIIGIAIESRQALALAAERDPQDDPALLKMLLAWAERGEARVRFCLASGNDGGADRELLSARLHDFPTEMPSIPSAWDTRPVGSRWQLRSEAFSLDQDLAPPAQSEWQLALDEPRAVMRMPRFRGLRLISTPPIKGVSLVSLLQIPQVMRGDGMLSDETLLIFSQTKSDRLPSHRVFETDIVVFEIPAAEVLQDSFQQLTDRVVRGSATLSAHVSVQSGEGVRALAQVVEEYMTATEFSDPPRPTSPLRTRPTALEVLPAGSRWEFEILCPDPGSDPIRINQEFCLTTDRPVEPPLKEILEIAARADPDYPGAPHHQVTWREGGLALSPGQYHCLGVRKGTRNGRDVQFAAFLRLRSL